ncbi:MAG: hypothetical protein IPG18_00960 [Saprospiraceae bacterium]|nr:hypothetical protein [Saprospiraceae bacterium]MBK9043035.1 hypothetical protein [Saprospiraceae bacterium]
MNADIAIFERLEASFSNVYMNKFPQSINLNESTAKTLVKNISQIKTDDKDKSGRYEVIYRVESVGNNYKNVKTRAKEIRDNLLNYTNTYIYLSTFDGEVYDTNETAEIHRVITDFRTFINY